jgi:outer membrane protein assembly factor BamB
MVRLPALLLLAAATAASGQATHRVVRSFPSPHGAGYASGLAYQGGVLWAAANNSATVFRVDAWTGATLGSFAAPGTLMRGLTHDGATLWAASWNPRTVYQLDPLTGAVLTSFPAPFAGGNPDGLAFDGAYLLLSDELNNVHLVDTTGALLRTIPVPASGAFNPRDLGWDGVFVYAGYQSSALIRRHDATTGAVLLTIPSPSGPFQQGLEWADWHLWATGGFNATISQIDVDPPYLNLLGTPTPGSPIQFRLTDAQATTGQLAVVALSATGTAGFNVGGTVVPVTFDGVTVLGLSLLPFFSATVDAFGVATTIPFTLPLIPTGISFWAAGVTLNGGNLTSVSDPIRFVTQ